MEVNVENGCTKEDAEIECRNNVSCIGYYCIDSKYYPKGFQLMTESVSELFEKCGEIENEE